MTVLDNRILSGVGLPHLESNAVRLPVSLWLFLRL